nr:hypothetical protein [uncultured Halomonas sp.]
MRNPIKRLRNPLQRQPPVAGIGETPEDSNDDPRLPYLTRLRRAQSHPATPNRHRAPIIRPTRNIRGKTELTKAVIIGSLIAFTAISVTAVGDIVLKNDDRKIDLQGAIALAGERLSEARIAADGGFVLPDLTDTTDEQDFDRQQADRQAAENALVRLENGSPATLSYFNPETLAIVKNSHQASLAERQQADEEMVSAHSQEYQAALIIVPTPDDDHDALLGAASEVLAPSVSWPTRVGRDLGGYSSDMLTPRALESAFVIGTTAEAARARAEMTEEERTTQVDAFHNSESLLQMTQQMGRQIAAHWSPVLQRFSNDGALLSVPLSPTGEVIEDGILVLHSTGRAAYDRAAIAAVAEAGSFERVASLSPWQREELSRVVVSFGKPPVSPQEYQRRKASGELAFFSGGEVLSGYDEDTDAYYPDVDYFDIIRRMVEQEVLASDMQRFDVAQDTTLKVSLSIPLGVIRAIEVDRSSENRHFDQLARDAVDAAAPFRGLRVLPLTEQRNIKSFRLHVHPHGVR